MWRRWRRYVPVAQRGRAAEREKKRLLKLGHAVASVVIEGREIARTFWGKSWCENLERYSDFANRLPRGRTYVRNGSVIDLKIAPGKVDAIVSGSAIYRVAVKVAAVPRKRWSSICSECAGAIDSLVELLQGRFSDGVMERICRQQTGLFPVPAEIKFSCSCPDWASMCKHVAAVLYGVGARLDEQPELLFKLREVDQEDLIAKADGGIPLAKTLPSTGKVLASEGLSELFGLEMSDPEAEVGGAGGAARQKPLRRGRANKAVAPAAAATTKATTRGKRRAPSTRTTKTVHRPSKLRARPKPGSAKR